jgi:S-methylmethionine-dependent homocysteine/selenocysteine methylase
MKLFPEGQQILVCDGAMGTMLHAAGAALDRSLPELNLSDPGLVSTIHESYLSAGADIIQTNTFGANRLWLGDHGLPTRSGRSTGPGSGSPARPRTSASARSWWPARSRPR